MDNVTGTELIATDVYSVYDFSHLPTWARDLQVVYLILIAVLGIPGNTCLILVLGKKENKSSTDYLILTMAVLETFCSGISSTLNMIRSISWWETIASTTFCKILIFVSYQFGLTSILLLASIAVDRYVKTCRPFNISFSVRKAKCMCLAILSTGVLMALPTLPVYSLDQNLACGHKSPLMKVYQRALLGVNMLVLLTVVIAYIKVAIVVKKQHNQQVERKLNGVYMSEPSNSRIKLKKLKSLSKKMGHRKIVPITENSQSETGVSQVPTQDGGSTSMSFNQKPEKLSETHSLVQMSHVTTSRTTEALNAIQAQNDSDDKYRNSKTDCVSAVGRRELLGRLIREEQRVNRTTWTLFLITFVYFATFFVNFILLSTPISVYGYTLRYFAITVNLINCVINPLLLFGMHAKFRADIKRIICCHGR